MDRNYYVSLTYYNYSNQTEKIRLLRSMYVCNENQIILSPECRNPYQSNLSSDILKTHHQRLKGQYIIFGLIISIITF